VPTLATFFGIVVSMYFRDQGEHHAPHVHVWYQGETAVYRIPDGAVLSGALPRRAAKLVEGWIALREAELMAAWYLAANGEHPGKVEPLR